MGFCDSILSFLLFFNNLIFAIIGIAITGLGVYNAVGLEAYYKFLGTSDEINILDSAGFIMIAVGVLLTVVYLIGCCGACTKNPCMLYTFSILLSLIILAEIGFGIALFMFGDKASGIIKTVMKESQEKFNSNTNDTIVVIGWNEIQTNFKCCGVDEYEDWKNHTTSADAFVPVSCCNKTSGCPTMRKDKPFLMKPDGDVFTVGCLMTLQKFVTENVKILGGAAVGLAFFHALSIVVACCFAKKEKDYDPVNAM